MQFFLLKQMLVYADIMPKELNVNQFSGIQAYLARVYCEDNRLTMAKIILFCFN